jgi:hypothetical protein
MSSAFAFVYGAKPSQSRRSGHRPTGTLFLENAAGPLLDEVCIAPVQPPGASAAEVGHLAGFILTSLYTVGLYPVAGLYHTHRTAAMQTSENSTSTHFGE